MKARPLSVFRNPVAALAALTVALCGAATAAAESVSWDGGGDGVRWSDPANWSSNALPSSVAQITIGAGRVVRLDIDYTGTERLTLSSSTARLIVDPGVHLFLDGIIENKGTIDIPATGALKGVPENEPGGTFNNAGTLTVESSGGANFFNKGLLSNVGTLVNNETITNTDGGIINNSGTLNNNGSLTNECGSQFTSTGTITGNAVVHACAQWDGGGDGVYWSDPLNWTQDTLPVGTKDILIPAGGFVVHLDTNFTITDRPGRLTIRAGSTLVIDSGHTLDVNGFGTNVQILGAFVNDGTLAVSRSGASFGVSAGGTLTNNARIDLQGGSLGVGGLMRNDGHVQVGAFGRLSNSNQLKNFGSIHNEADGEIRNLSGGVFENDGEIVNDGRFSNGILSQCGGSIVNRGTLTGNPVVEVCKRWDGGGDGSHWSDARNWTIDMLPTGDDDERITISSAVVHLDMDFVGTGRGRLEIGPSATLVVETGRRLFLDGVIDNRGILENNGSVKGIPSNNASGTIDNAGSLTVESSGGANFFNHGALNNTGTITNNETITNASGGLIDNSGDLVNNGSMVNECGGRFVNTGSVTGHAIVFACAEWDGGGDGRNWSDPLNWLADELPAGDQQVIIPAGSSEVHLDVDFTLTARPATLTVPAGASLTVDAGSTLTIAGFGTNASVEGTLVNQGTLVLAIGGTGLSVEDGGHVHNTAGGRIENRGSINALLRGTLRNDGTIDTYSNLWVNLGGGPMRNFGLIRIHPGGELRTVSGGLFYNDGAVENASRILNDGRFENDCDGSVTGAGTWSGAAAVDVCDTVPPVVTVPADFRVEATSPAGALVTFTATASDDRDGPLAPSCSPRSGSPFVLGETTVTCTAGDAAGNSSSESFVVTVSDTTPPTVTPPPDVVVPTDPGRPTALVTDARLGTPTATDRVGVAEMVRSGVPAGNVFPVGTTTVVYSARDAAGNVGTASQHVTVRDLEPPVLSVPADVIAEATSPAGAVVADAVLGMATATDNVPGVTVTRSGVPAGNLFPLGTTIVTYTATDVAGNSASATQQVLVRDTTPPVITLSSPTAGTYTLGQVVAADYTCTDTVSPVATCSGPVPSGSPFDTATVGSKVFTVHATDSVGNAAARSVSYDVAFGVCLLYDHTKAKKSGSTIPLKIQLCDSAGRNVSSPADVVTAVQLVKLSDSATSAVEDAGNSNPDDNFRWDAGLAGYIFNLKTTGLATGTYAMAIRASGDPTLHGSEVLFQIR
jgi:hypothetical protein